MMLKRFLVFICIQAWLLCATAQTYTAGQCQPVPSSKTCIDQTPCKTSSTGEKVCLAGSIAPAGALTLPQTCWQYSHQYACANAIDSVNTCSALSSNSSCTMKKNECVAAIPETGACSQWQYTYSCQTSPAKTQKQLVCSMGSLAGGPSIPAPAKSNNSFSQAMLAQEIAREAGVYGQGGTKLFAGVTESCSTGYLGIKNCCKSTPGAKSNSAAMTMAFSGAFSVVKYAGQKAVDTVSPYVFDAMYNTGLYTNGMLQSIGTSANVATNELGDLAATNFASNGLTLSAYGFTYGTGTAPAAGSGFMNASNTLWQSEGGSGFVTFNPYVFGAMVAVQVIMSLASCDQTEQLLALHRGANLSTQITQYCSKRVPIINTCIEWKTEFCSFNSVFARLINIQGKTQLGLPLAGCSGFAIDDLGKIDFTKIDFSELIQSMTNQATSNTPTDMKTNYQNSYDGKLQNGSAQGKNSALPTYRK